MRRGAKMLRTEIEVIYKDTFFVKYFKRLDIRYFDQLSEELLEEYFELHNKSKSYKVKALDVFTFYMSSIKPYIDILNEKYAWSYEMNIVRYFDYNQFTNGVDFGFVDNLSVRQFIRINVLALNVMKTTRRKIPVFFESLINLLETRLSNIRKFDYYTFLETQNLNEICNVFLEIDDIDENSIAAYYDKGQINSLVELALSRVESPASIIMQYKFGDDYTRLLMRKRLIERESLKILGRELNVSIEGARKFVNRHIKQMNKYFNDHSLNENIISRHGDVVELYELAADDELSTSIFDQGLMDGLFYCQGYVFTKKEVYLEFVELMKKLHSDVSSKKIRYIDEIHSIFDNTIFENKIDVDLIVTEGNYIIYDDSINTSKVTNTDILELFMAKPMYEKGLTLDENIIEQFVSFAFSNYNKEVSASEMGVKKLIDRSEAILRLNPTTYIHEKYLNIDSSLIMELEKIIENTIDSVLSYEELVACTEAFRKEHFLSSFLVLSLIRKKLSYKYKIGTGRNYNIFLKDSKIKSKLDILKNEFRSNSYKISLTKLYNNHKISLSQLDDQFLKNQNFLIKDDYIYDIENIEITYEELDLLEELIGNNLKNQVISIKAFKDIIDVNVKMLPSIIEFTPQEVINIISQKIKGYYFRNQFITTNKYLYTLKDYILNYMKAKKTINKSLLNNKLKTQGFNDSTINFNINVLINEKSLVFLSDEDVAHHLYVQHDSKKMELLTLSLDELFEEKKFIVIDDEVKSRLFKDLDTQSIRRLNEYIERNEKYTIVKSKSIGTKYIDKVIVKNDDGLSTYSTFLPYIFNNDFARSEVNKDFISYLRHQGIIDYACSKEIYEISNQLTQKDK